MMRTYKSNKTNKIVFRFDEKKKAGDYVPAAGCAFDKLCRKVVFRGFIKPPKGFSRDGYGFANPAGSFLTRTLRDSLGDGIELAISYSEPTACKKRYNHFSLTLNHHDYLSILDPLRDIRSERNKRSNAHIAAILHRLLPKQFSKPKDSVSLYSYEEDKLSKIINSDPSVAANLSKTDIETIARLYGQVAKDASATFATIGVAEESKRQNERVYLESVVSEFRRRIQSAEGTERDWQRFLQKYILLFNTSYVSVIEKLNIDLAGKYPDFLLMNVYGYLDVYEIKKPTTNLLRHDDSRDNYYWDVEVAKAITQTEKYIQLLIQNDLKIRDILKTKQSIDVKVVRPRGFVVVGSSVQFTNKRMNDDFRLLASSLKNVDIVLYDELLANLENLLNRLAAQRAKK